MLLHIAAAWMHIVSGIYHMQRVRSEHNGCNDD
jgi:hypothetical protein